jgi:mRNA-degrading endonuclease RelE of RelBE toxin-antitoxin system
MSYQVIWSTAALRQLAALWMAASNRMEITRAQSRIDKALALDPKSAGKEIADGLWRIRDDPLLVYFEINDAHRILRVTDVYVLP